MPRVRVNISYKITLIFCIILVIVFTGVFSYLQNNLGDFVYQRIRSALLKETLLIKMFLEEDFPGYPRLKKIDKVLDRVGYTVDSRVTIISLDGTVLGDTGLAGSGLEDLENHLYRPEVQEALASGAGESIRFSTTIRKNMLYVAVPFGKESTAGVIRLALPLSDIDVVSGKVRNTLFASLAAAFLLIALGSLIASKIITRSIKDMASAARHVAGGGNVKKVPVRGNDEISDLAGAFNYMSQEMNSRIEEVISGRKRLETVLLSMFDGVMVVGARGEISLINRALRDILRVSEDPAGKKPFEVLRNPELQALTDRVLAPSGKVEAKEISVLMPEKRTLLVHASPIKREGRPEGAVLVFHDITELRRLEKIRRDFVANVSHELRTPASNIKGFTETLLGGALDDRGHAEEFLRIIQDNSDRLVKLVEDLLDLSRIESGRIAPDQKPCSLRRISEGVLNNIDKKAFEKNITLSNNIDKNMPDVMADESMLAQVFLNLIDNAIRYTASGGTVELAARQSGDMITVSIKDNGRGIEEKHIPRIFERFYCADKARSRDTGGTGLGLSIVKHIVRDHGGEVFVQSVPEKGSTFSFTIPKAHI